MRSVFFSIRAVIPGVTVMFFAVIVNFIDDVLLMQKIQQQRKTQNAANLVAFLRLPRLSYGPWNPHPFSRILAFQPGKVRNPSRRMINIRRPGAISCRFVVFEKISSRMLPLCGLGGVPGPFTRRRQTVTIKHRNSASYAKETRYDALWRTGSRRHENGAQPDE